MGAKLGWSKEEQMKYTAELEKALTDAVIPVNQQEQARCVK